MQVVRTKTIPASARAVWDLVGDFNGLPRFVPAVTESRMDGDGVGAVRTIKVAGTDGETIERCEAYDDAGMSFVYSVLRSSLSMRGYRATVSVLTLSDEECEVRWESTFEPVGDVPADITAGFIADSYEGALECLSERFSS